MMKLRLSAALLLAIAPLAPLNAMTVSEFLAKADALEKKGAMALFSSDLKVLKNEVQAAGKALRAEQNSARAAGRKPATCIPEKAGIDSKELIAWFRAIPAPRRTISVKDGFAGLVRKKYPCRG